MKKRCGYCGKEYSDSENGDSACRYHPEFYFPYDIDKDAIHTKGWQCCGSEDPSAPGCVITRHRDDVKKVYRFNSIAYDYVEIDFEDEKRKKELYEARKQKLRKLSEDPETGEIMKKIESYGGKKLSSLIVFAGEPAGFKWISNGSSGFVHHRKELFFRYLIQDKELVFRVSTDYEPIGMADQKNYDFTVEGITWYADSDALEEYKKTMITDLTGD